MFLGVKAVLAKSFARIHKANLVNFGILPLTFSNPQDYDKLEQGHYLEFPDVKEVIEKGEGKLRVTNKSLNAEFEVIHDLSEEQMKVILAGGLLNYVKGMQR